MGNHGLWRDVSKSTYGGLDVTLRRCAVHPGFKSHQKIDSF